MKILVIGSGLIGLSSAYLLKKRGHEVTVIDREEGPGRQTSFANGALLTPGMSDPWNSPGCWRALLGSLVRSDAALKLRLRTIPSLAGWGVRFLRNSNAVAFEHNTFRNLQLGLYSLQVLATLRRETHIEYARTASGSLKIFRDSRAFDRACTAAARLRPWGLSFRQLSGDQAIELEPALMPIAGQLTGAVHYETDETGDAYQFCVALAEHARQQGVQFRFHREVSSLEVRLRRVTAVVSGRERLIADRYLVAAGSYSTPLLRTAGIDLPVRPAKGYSVTFQTDQQQPDQQQRREGVLGLPIVDDEWHAAVVPLNSAIRVAGTAEFAGFDRSLRPERVRNLVSIAQRILPPIRLDPATAKSWCGLRPMSADGVPIIGRTRIPNLFVNTGHGHLGWTMAAGSAELLTDLIHGSTPSVDPTPYELSRFR